MGAPKPKGTVCVSSAEAGTEYVDVPASVARELVRMAKAGECDPQTRDELFRLMDEVTRRAARGRILKMLERRDHSEHEVRERLEQEGFGGEAIGEAVERCAEAGLISNQRFADAFIRGKIAAGWGSERIERELARRGVNTHDVAGWPYEYLDPEDEYERALDLAHRKRVREPNAYAKMVRFLVGRGYAYDVCLRVAKEVVAQAG